ncbi:MaoC/PaaZ C-terminal domain-containing protein [Streptomyces flavidovirens]|uniref:MaoC/PaaZ C-terminal domain-containing protein n=1 Tax=Streptomyces flavidovirens TaxID=67298 RepID=UPI0003FB39B5|nr:MaoC/PaaZ C-terminal domain-containing protein [Streptomyces flavidovirens]
MKQPKAGLAIDVEAFRAMLGMADGTRHDGERSGVADIVPNRLAPLGLLAAAALRASADLLGRTGPGDGMVPIHGAQKLCVHRPVRAGEELASDASVLSVRPLGAGTVREVLVRFTDTVGAPVAESTSLIVHTPPAAAPANAVKPPAPTGSRPGQESVRTSSFTVTRALVQQYATLSGDHNPIHLSERAARAAGFPDTIAHGMLTFALAGHHLAGLAGEERVKEIQLRFAKPLIVPPGGAMVALSDRPLPSDAPEQGGLLLTATDGVGTTIARGRAVVEHRTAHTSG